MAVIVLISAFAGNGQVSPYRTFVDKFTVSKWTTEHGLPQNTVTSIVQTHDGYLWIGTFGGLARFDGVRFTVFDSTNQLGLASNRILSLYEDRRQRLWVGTETGEVYIYADGKFVEFKSDPDFKRVTVWEILEDDNGRMFIASDSGLERVEFRDDGSLIAESVRIISRNRCFQLAKGPGNTIWTSSGKALLVQGDELVKAESLGKNIPKDILHMDFSADGRMIVDSIHTFGWFANDRFDPIPPPKGIKGLSGCTPAFQAGKLRCQEGNRLHEFNDDRIETHDLGDTVVGGSRKVFFDKEDNIWLATESDGLVRLSPKRISLVGDLTEFDVWGRFALIEDAEGAVWLGGHDLLKVQNDKVEKIVVKTPVGTDELITALAVDSNGVIWAGGRLGLYSVENGKVIRLPQFSGGQIDSLFIDSQSTLWVGTPSGLWRRTNDEFTKFTTDDGLPSNSVHFITESKDGALWIGTFGGASRFKDGTFENFTTENGLSANYVREILEDENGMVWIGTYGGGINRLSDGKISTITTANGIHDNFVSRILVDNVNKFWILGNHGVFSVKRDDLNAVADGRSNSVIGAVYGVADGMESSEASGGHQPAGIKTKDGRLWFPMIKDVVILDPKDGNQTPPKVVIEGLSTRSDDARSLPNALDIRQDAPISIPTGQRDLEVQFTGLSFTKPESIKFYYRLDDLDNDWTDAGNRRKAIYPYLPAGTYTFRVRAVNALGVMSENTATLNISVDKPFWRKWWFILLALIGATFAAFMLYRFKMEQIKAQRLKEIEFSKQLLKAQEVERGRIASELHDGLGQNLLILRNWAQLGLDAAEDPNEVREHLLQISETAAQSIDETRSIVRNLSPQNLKRFGLTEAIRNMIEQLHSSTGVVFESKIDNIDDLFPEEAELSIYRIVQECLNNVVKHSESPRGRVAITRSPEVVEIVIEDYGKGFSANEYLEYDDSKRGFGVQSIIQRVKLLGGEINFESRSSEGTKIQIRLKK
ncbi:MAG: hypothetical protein JNL64_04575 [Blastocatellia bacterium]|nr:hypothetical protein [Blastocatellia bacterium]